jgi:hypothetical protein
MCKRYEAIRAEEAIIVLHFTTILPTVSSYSRSNNFLKHAISANSLSTIRTVFYRSSLRVKIAFNHNLSLDCNRQYILALSFKASQKKIVFLYKVKFFNLGFIATIYIARRTFTFGFNLLWDLFDERNCGKPEL